jgi:uncharacterized OB-fold protein
MSDVTETIDGLKAAVPCLAFHEDHSPYLRGTRCKVCGETFVDLRENCPACASRGQMDTIELATTGRLYNYSIVYRSFPGVKVPFISAVVDLDGGGTLKGNLVDMPVDPAAIAFDMPVEVVFRDAGIANPAGEGFTGYFIIPRKEAE